MNTDYAWMARSIPLLSRRPSRPGRHWHYRDCGLPASGGDSEEGGFFGQSARTRGAGTGPHDPRPGAGGTTVVHRPVAGATRRTQDDGAAIWGKLSCSCQLGPWGLEDARGPTGPQSWGGINERRFSGSGARGTSRRTS